jgi:hypothetical protein
MPAGNSRRRIARAAYCALVVVGGLSIAAAPAVAKKKHKKKPPAFGPVVTATATGNTTTAADETSTAVANCPAGTQAVGGGFSATPPGGTNFFSVFASFRSSPTSWTVKGYNQTGNGTATAYAYCRKTTKSITDVTGSATIPAPFGTGTATATCPSGTQLIGGGFDSTTQAPGSVGFPQINMSTSPGSWTVKSFNNAFDELGLTAHAYCVAGIRASLVLQKTASGSPGPTEALSASTDSCPAPPKPKKKKGKKKRKRPQARLLSAGGFAFGSTPVQLPVFTENRISGTGWLASATQYGPSEPLSVTTQGFCV